MKDLIYFVIGGNPDYVNLLRYCIHTIRCFPENDVYDILVMCDESYVSHLRGLPIKYIYVTPFNENHVQASMRKVEIFDFSKIHEYDRVLYLDCDIVICGPLHTVFEKITDEEKVYVVPERKDIESHTLIYYHRVDKPYTQDELYAFARENVYVFNAGQFGFRVSETTRKIFTDISEEKKKYYNPHIHFYEQCFMNDYMNRRRLCRYDIESFVQLDANVHSASNQRIVIHFCNATIPYSEKLINMKNFHEHFWKDYPFLSILNSRNEIADVVNISQEGEIAEIGSFKGDFAEVLRNRLKPKRLHLIDPWTGSIVSGDQDGNNVLCYDGQNLYDYVHHRFRDDHSVVIHRALSSDIRFANLSLDLVYIDGDHSYEGVQKDLQLAIKWVRYGGWICGHDFAMNKHKTKNHYDFGVQRAVLEFCKEHGFRIWALMMDGCVSFAIRK